MKNQLIATALIVSSVFLTGCAGLPLIPLSPFAYLDRHGCSTERRGCYDCGSSGSSVDSGIDPITQAGIDADNAATTEQSNQDIRDAAAAASAASMSQ